MTVTLENLKQQLAHYTQERANHQQIFHQISGAIAIIEELISKFVTNDSEPKQESHGNGQVIDQSTEQVTEE